MEKEIKKIYITGDKRYMDDFVYLFPDLNIARIPYEDFKSKKEYGQVVLCCSKNEATMKEMDQLNLTVNVDFLFASDYIEKWISYEIKRMAQEKNIALWGAGNTGEWFLPYLGGLDIDCVIDSSADGGIDDRWRDYKLFNPNSLDVEFWQEHFVLITSNFYDEIKSHLSAYHCIEFEDYISYKAFPVGLTDKIVKALECNAVYSCVCPQIEKTITLNAVGDIFPCVSCGWSDALGNVFYNSVQNVLDSVINRAFQISIRNKTYSFCYKDNCDILFNSDRYSPSKCREAALILPSGIGGVAYDDGCNLYCSTCREEVRGGRSSQKDYLHKVFINDILPRCSALFAAGNGEIFASGYYRDLLSDKNLENIRYIFLVSNGVNASAERVQHLCSITEGTGIIISVDAAYEATYKKIRRGGDYKKLWSNIAQLGELYRQGVLKALGLVFVISRTNYKEMVQFAKMAEENGVGAISYIKVDNWGMWTEEEFRSLNMTDENRIPKQELQDELEKLEALSFNVRTYYDQEYVFLKDMADSILR